MLTLVLLGTAWTVSGATKQKEVMTDELVRADLFGHLRYGVAFSANLDGETADESIQLSVGGTRFVCVYPSQEELKVKQAEVEESVVSPDDADDNPEDAEEIQKQKAIWRGLNLVYSLPCFKMNQGWWHYEVCPAGGITQYHPQTPEEVKAQQGKKKTDKLLYNLGKRKASDYTNTDIVTSSVEGKQQSYLSVWYRDGDECDLTGQKRQVEVQYQCSPQIGMMDRIVSVREIRTCVYAIKVETARLCADEAFVAKSVGGRSGSPESVARRITCRPLDSDSVFKMPGDFKGRDSENDYLSLARISSVQPGTVAHSLSSLYPDLVSSHPKVPAFDISKALSGVGGNVVVKGGDSLNSIVAQLLSKLGISVPLDGEKGADSANAEKGMKQDNSGFGDDQDVKVVEVVMDENGNFVIDPENMELVKKFLSNQNGQNEHALDDVSVVIEHEQDKDESGISERDGLQELPVVAEPVSQQEESSEEATANLDHQKIHDEIVRRHEKLHEEALAMIEKIQKANENEETKHSQSVYVETTSHRKEVRDGKAVKEESAVSGEVYQNGELERRERVRVHSVDGSDGTLEDLKAKVKKVLFDKTIPGEIEHGSDSDGDRVDELKNAIRKRVKGLKERKERKKDADEGHSEL